VTLWCAMTDFARLNTQERIFGAPTQGTDRPAPSRSSPRSLEDWGVVPQSARYYHGLHGRQLQKACAGDDGALPYSVSMPSPKAKVDTSRVYGGEPLASPTARIKGLHASTIKEKGSYSDGLWRSLPNHRVSPTSGKIVSTSSRCFESTGDTGHRRPRPTREEVFGVPQSARVPQQVLPSQPPPEQCPRADSLRHQATPRDTFSLSSPGGQSEEPKRLRAAVQSYKKDSGNVLAWQPMTGVSLAPAERCAERRRDFNRPRGGYATTPAGGASSVTATAKTSPRWRY